MDFSAFGRQGIIDLMSNLPTKQQKEIAILILHGLKSPDPDAEQAWMNEVERRARVVDSMKIGMIPGDQAMQRLGSITQNISVRIKNTQSIWDHKYDYP